MEGNSNMKKQLQFAFWLTVLCLTQSVSARVWDGKIDSEWYWDNPQRTEFTISTAAQLAGLAQLVNGGNDFSGKTIKLGANIMLNDTANWQNWNEAKPTNVWTPIGSYTNENNNRAFSGTFDGNNYVVNGIYINNSNSYQGLFGYTFKATIKNLGVTASYIKGSSIIGGLAGFNNNSVITNCYSKVNVEGKNHDVGSLVGSNKGTIIKCYATGNVIGNSIVGGLIGSNEGTIANCYATGNVYSSSAGIDGASIGGLVGDNGGTIKDCYAVGKVIGSKSVGGLIGNNHKTVTNCYALGDVASYNFGFGGLIGGLVGENSGKIANCYATGNVNGYGNQGNNIGGLVGSNSGIIDDCYATGKVAGQDNIGGLVGFDGGSTIGFNTKTTSGGIITNCYAIGNVNGSNRVGGLVGKDIGSSIIKNSFATGNVTGENDDVGGLVGNNFGAITNSYAKGDIAGKNNIGGLVGITSGKITITNCYAVGKVSGITGSTIGGLTGVNSESTIKNSYYDRQTSTQVDINKGEPKSTTQMKQQATFTNWDFSKIWKIDAGKNNGYPYLRGNGNVTETETATATTTTEATPSIKKGSFTDTRDNKKYRIVKINEQIWMAENLNYDAIGSKCYNNDQDNCEKYGRLYDFATAKKACPPKWHLPNPDEWKTLVDFAGGKEVAGKNLKAKSGWEKSGNGTDIYGFSALPGGVGLGDNFGGEGNTGCWLSTDGCRGMVSDIDEVTHDESGEEEPEEGNSELFSVRCLHD